MDLDIATSSIQYVLPYLVPVILFLVASSLWRWYVDSTRDAASSLPLPPGTVGLPFVGETFNMLMKGFDFYRDKRDKYGHVYKTHILGRPTVRVWGTENVQKILQNEERLVTMSWPTSVLELMGRGGLVTSQGRCHNLRRMAVMKAFTESAVKDYAKGMEKILSKFIASWCEKGQVTAAEESKKLAFQTTARMLLGFNFSSGQMKTMMESMTVIAENFFTLPIDLPGFGFHKAMKARRQLIKTLEDIISQDDDAESMNALLILRQEVDSGRLTKQELMDTLIEMLFSAFHGMTSLCCSAFVQLGKNPEVIDGITRDLRDAELLNGELPPERLSQLPYLRKVVKELLRFAPPYGGGYRKVLKTFELEGYQVPKGWSVLYSIRDQHEAEENFTDARTFNPDRWDSEKATDAYIPYGGKGSRSCVGEKYMNVFIQVFLCQVSRSCQWELQDRNTTFTHFPVQMPTTRVGLNFTESTRKLKH